VISGAAAAVVGVIASIVLGVAGLGVQLRSAKRVERDREAAQITDAYGKGYVEGDRDARAALHADLRIVTSERDAARERSTECARQIEALQAEIRRMQRGGKP
jgi:hypothetical protein